MCRFFWWCQFSVIHNDSYAHQHRCNIYYESLSMSCVIVWFCWHFHGAQRLCTHVHQMRKFPSIYKTFSDNQCNHRFIHLKIHEKLINFIDWNIRSLKTFTNYSISYDVFGRNISVCIWKSRIVNSIYWMLWSCLYILNNHSACVCTYKKWETFGQMNVLEWWCIE